MNPCKKKLIEVALPLEAINVASAEEAGVRRRQQRQGSFEKDAPKAAPFNFTLCVNTRP